MNKKVGIIGLGIIGSAVQKVFPKAIPYDPYVSNKLLNKNGIRINSLYSKDLVKSCDIVFICVPTPVQGDLPYRSDGLSMKIIEEVVAEFNIPLLVICSALQPGTADRLMQQYDRRIVVQPEYFGETINHPLTDLSSNKFLILGGKSKDVDEVIGLYQEVYNANIRIRKVTALEAEVIKLSENRAIFFKVLQCQELYDACQKAGVDYNIVREAVYGDDPRFNLWFTFVYPENRGCSSKCIPKDVYGWKKWANECGMNTNLTDGLLLYNDYLINGGSYEPALKPLEEDQPEDSVENKDDYGL